MPLNTAAINMPLVDCQSSQQTDCAMASVSSCLAPRLVWHKRQLWLRAAQGHDGHFLLCRIPGRSTYPEPALQTIQAFGSKTTYPLEAVVPVQTCLSADLIPRQLRNGKQDCLGPFDHPILCLASIHPHLQSPTFFISEFKGSTRTTHNGISLWMPLL